MISSFHIIDAEVIVSLPDGTVYSIDIRSNILQVDFYENLSKPYVDCDILLNDDFGFRDKLRIQGTERIVIRIGTGEEQQPIIEKSFFVAKINDVVATNERSEILSITLAEEHVFIDAVKQISRSYEGNLETIVGSILERDLGKKLTLFSSTSQGVRKVIIPYLSPIQAIYWLTDRASNDMGAPMFVYGNLYTEQIWMADLETLMNLPPINEKVPYYYSSAIASGGDNPILPREYYEIKTYSEKNMENSLQLYEEGAIGSYFETLDAGTGKTKGGHVSVREIVQEMYTKGLISSKQAVFDPTLEIDGKLSDEYNSLHIHQVTSKGTYNQFLSYHDEYTLLDKNNNQFESKLKVKGKIIRQLMKRNVIDIEMEGDPFLKSRIAVGIKLRLLFLNSDIQDDTPDIRQLLDTRKSGDYLILAIKHQMTTNDAGHNVSLRLTKLSDIPADAEL